MSGFAAFKKLHLFVSVSALVLSLGGCAAMPSGPIFGDWYGYQPLPVPQSQLAVELVLHGAADARTGTYRIHYQTLWGQGSVFTRSDYLNGAWARTPMTIDGVPCALIVLSPDGVGPSWGAMVTRYIELPNRLLIRATDHDRPDLTQDGLLYRLAPRKPTDFGYGRV
ncbi:hypothetical protein [Brytella acorum]|uniref:Lipoprotein n=1 Tax=Brytella acorum TaxID=2959299 RepID=A0AA35XVM3_9PROT|nr:hypothetical protein [Brytella acorum]MDF3623683.1 hypothetical protein [Brytella acorum]CAI9119899.1 hypothetical protein LMG32879_000725 [Brytella acorum]